MNWLVGWLVEGNSFAVFAVVAAIKQSGHGGAGNVPQNAVMSKIVTGLLLLGEQMKMTTMMMMINI